eukprot:TRINITY_DN20901_c0_g1_i1.p1 TRINITY_DN20901_c0_g1~~TRINITY_DN20901_c0_g1_i1.p1  ORF type:complete len:912 (+),score=66.56 TRINITY_DN20901_c0_g1_i1:74-2809(+)
MSSLILFCTCFIVALLPLLTTSDLAPRLQCAVGTSDPKTCWQLHSRADPSRKCDAGGCNREGPSIPNFHELECAMHQLAFEFGTAKVPSSPQALHDALILGNCSQFADSATLELNRQILSSRPWPRKLPPAPAANKVFVSTDGDDSTGDGSSSKPFATLHAAASAMRGRHRVGKGMVIVRGGKYYLNDTLRLGKEDSNVIWTVADGEHVTLSGGKRLALQWKSYKGGILRAQVAQSQVLSADELSFLNARPPPDAFDFGPPPALWNTLFADGARQVRARYPNGDPQQNSGICFSNTNHPEIEGCSSYLSAQGALGCVPDPLHKDQEINCTSLPDGPAGSQVSFGLDRGLSPTMGCEQCSQYGTFKYTIYNPPEGHPVYNKPLPGIGWKNNSVFSFWRSPFSRPGGFKYNQSDNVPKLKRPAGAVVHMFHGGLWGGWQYSVSSQTDTALLFGYGGYQEARGSGISKNQYYIENDLSLLDAPGEWYYDKHAGELYFWPNTTNGEAPDEIVAPLLDSIVAIDGAVGVSFSGFAFTETRATFLSQYEVPSGGDWAIHRGAAFFVQDSSRIEIKDCVFNQTGGNAVMFSNNVVNSSVTSSEFVHIGDSAIVTIGSTDTIFGTGATFPNRILIANNHIREIGIFGKQTSCYFQALAANVTLRDNLCYNGPRAGININDGFAGNNLVQGNLVLNMVRETGDHGPYNSWDRQPYLTNSGVDDGYKTSQKYGSTGSILKKNDFIKHNFIINSYNGVWAIDHDDGSQFFNDTKNLMLWGGCKNFLGHSKSCDHNVMIYPGYGRASSHKPCQTDDNSVFANQYHHDNQCITIDGNAYSMGGWDKCTSDSIDQHVYQTFNNTLFAPKGNFTAPGPCPDFKTWQATGQDAGSQVLPLPSISEVVEMSNAVLARVRRASEWQMYV